jgi:hypothetical protein
LGKSSTLAILLPTNLKLSPPIENIKIERL